MKRISMHLKCIKLHLQEHPHSVLRIVIAAICGVVVYEMTAAIFVNLESVPLTDAPKFPGIGFTLAISTSILFSILFWHLLLWPVLFSKNLFIFLKPKPCLFVIDYIWYVGAFIAFAAVANLAVGQYLKSENEISFFDAENIRIEATIALKEKTNNCLTINGYQEAYPRYSFNTEGFNEVQLICNSELSVESSEVDIMNTCPANSGSTDKLRLYPKGTDQASVPKLFGLALADVSSICYYSRLLSVSKPNTDRFLYSSGPLDRDFDGPDSRIFFLPILLIGLRLVKSTSEVISSDRAGFELFFSQIMLNFKGIKRFDGIKRFEGLKRYGGTKRLEGLKRLKSRRIR